MPVGAEPVAQGIPVDQIRPNPRQPRAGFSGEAFEELVASVREQGVLQPVLVRPVTGGYELVAGERRWRAAVAAGLRVIPAVVREMDDRASAEAALVENLQREDLNPVERAQAYRRLIEEFHLTQEEVARRVGKSQPAVANSLRLLSLPSQVLTSLQAGRISEGHARALLGVQDETALIAVWKRVETSGLSVRETESIVKRAAISREIQRVRRKPRDIVNIEQELSSSLGAPATIIVNNKGSGEIRILFYSSADLQRLVERLRGGGSR
ncbi:MAG: ParB/RepB/Spo0J family partition protein [Armatimonadota bacterium]|nr:ParB/RepB/Spo0J family partition protein [Armatimonadota bacterium]MDR7531929.1 ParB/RepB/Spo0J family partition protein [Armatimonadota bacterium]